MMDKPHFDVDQIVPASLASKRFGEVRKNAKKLPQFILDNNRIDSVILDYTLYEQMFIELQALRELAWEYEIVRRVREADIDPNASLDLIEVIGEKEFSKFQSIDPNVIADEDLFE
jgi:hypothetical protein